jgi:hypothetical protein
MTSAQYRAKAAQARALAESATNPSTRDLHLNAARDWTALSVMAIAHEKTERDLRALP